MKNINLRLEDELHAKLKDAAEQQGRSLNQQIAWLLKRGLASDSAAQRYWAESYPGQEGQQ